jgi:hypothetical protein
MWSLAIAAVLHVLAFLYLPGLPPSEPGDVADDIDELAVVTGSAIPLDLFFGPPVIRNVQGGLAFEPPERVHEEGRAVFVTLGCKRLIEGSTDVHHGTVRLTVLETGLVEVQGVVESTGSRCGDDVIARVAGDLWYRWLPNDDFPAPVEVVQPLTFAEARGLF